jgi:hypothetical protein
VNSPNEQIPPSDAPPIAELVDIVDQAGTDIRGIFGAVLTSFAGPYAINETYAEKKAGLERLIRGQLK